MTFGFKNTLLVEGELMHVNTLTCKLSESCFCARALARTPITVQQDTCHETYFLPSFNHRYFPEEGIVEKRERKNIRRRIYIVDFIYPRSYILLKSTGPDFLHVLWKTYMY